MAILVVVMVSLATAKPVPGYKIGSDPTAEAQWLLHRNIKKEYGNQKWYEGLKNSNVKFVQAEEMAFAAKNPSSQTSVPVKPAAVIAPVVPAKTPSLG